MQISNELRTMILRRKPGHTLEAPFYESREVFDLDVEAIFGRHWIFAGVEPDIPSRAITSCPDRARLSIRGARRRHVDSGLPQCVPPSRGASCDGNKGSVGNIVRPYHQWTYTSRASSSSPSTWVTVSTATSTA